MKDFHLVIVKPEVHVNTRTAYQNAHIQQSKIPIKEIIARPVEGWRNLLHNNFEETIFPAYPKIGEIKKTLYQNDALYASMSGSGAAVYGIFNKFTDLRILFPGFFYWSGLL
nr:hypothetical protein [Bacteroidota bacterium]